MSELNWDLADAMAIAVLRRDRVAAIALADKLCQEVGGFDRIIQEAIQTRESEFSDSYTVYSWPEFQAFCKRLGLIWDLRTVDLTIHMPALGTVEITQKYRGSDMGEQA